jgi:hypothetical protein
MEKSKDIRLGFFWSEKRKVLHRSEKSRRRWAKEDSWQCLNR